MTSSDDLDNAMEDPNALPFSEDAMADLFSQEHAEDLRYVAQWAQWLEWDGCRWRKDTTVHVFDLVRRACRAVAAQCNEKNAKGLVRAAYVASVERFAKADRRHAITYDQLDAHPFLLNTPEGTVDLRSGASVANDPEHYLTKVTAVAPSRDQPAPIWRDFLSTITDGDDELAGFLQRMAGYCATGSVREHALFFLFGKGRNGKSVFSTTLARILADFHRTARTEMFMLSRTDSHPTELAGLHGARFVSASETEKGQWWAEAKIKALTGGDILTARFMRQNFFEFAPQFKLVIRGNDRPRLRSVDEAIRRRMHLIPFTVTISEAQVDVDLEDRLRAEWPAILQWIIDGAVEWFEHGLRPPLVVRAATDEYLRSEDTVATFLDECCDTGDPKAYISSSLLFTDFKSWCDQGNERPGTHKAFSEALTQLGHTKEKRRDGVFWLGIKRQS